MRPDGTVYVIAADCASEDGGHFDVVTKLGVARSFRVYDREIILGTYDTLDEARTSAHAHALQYDFEYHPRILRGRCAVRLPYKVYFPEDGILYLQQLKVMQWALLNLKSDFGMCYNYVRFETASEATLFKLSSVL